MLTQQIALYSLLLTENTDTVSRAAARTELLNLIAQMEREHQWLREQQADLPVVNALYDEPPVNMTTRLTEFWLAARQVSDLPAGASTRSDPNLIFILDNAPRLVESVEQIIAQFQQVSGARINDFEELNRLRIAIVLIALLAQTIFIFRPALQHLREKVQSLQREVEERQRTEAALKASERRFRTLVDHSPVGIYETDAAGQTLFVNKTWQEMTGLSLEAAQGRGWRAAWHPDDLKMLDEHRANQPPLTEVYHRDYRLVRGNKVLYVHGTTVPFVGADGSIVGYVGNVVDLSPMREATIELEARNQLIDKVLSTNVAAITISDETGFIRYANQRAIELLGLEADPAMPGHFAAPQWLTIAPNANPHAEADSILQQIAATGQPMLNVRRTAVLPDGSRRHLLINAAPLNGLNGKREVVTSTMDVTEEVLAEQKLRMSERRFRTLVDSLPIGIFQTDNSGNCIFVNERWTKMAGLTLPQALGAGWVAALHPDDLNEVFTEWRSAIKEQREFNLNYRYQRSGISIYVHGTSVALRDDDGTIIGYLGTVMDITLVRQTQIELESRNRLIEGVLNTNVAAVMIVDERGIRYANPLAEQLLTLTKQDIHSTYYDHPEWRTLHVDGRPLAQTEYTFVQVVQSEAPLFGIQRILEWPDGTRKYVSVNAALLKTPSGAHEVVNAVEDISERVRAEMALRESELRFRTLVAAAPVGILQTDAQLNLVFANERWLKMFEYTQERASEHGWMNVLPADIRQRMINTNADKVVEESVLHLEYQYKLTASTLYVHTVTLPLTLEDGSISGFLTTVTDVTSLREVQLQLEARNQLIENILNSNVSGIVIVDADLRIRYANKHAAAFFESSQEALTSGDPSVWRWKLELVSDRELDPETQIFGHIIKTGQPVYNVHYVVRWNDGRTKHISINAGPLDDPQTGRREVVYSFTDISEQVSAEQKLRESEELFRQLAENTDDALYVLDPITRKALYASPAFAKIHGRAGNFESEDLTHYLTFVHPDDRETFLSGQVEMLANGGGEREYRIVRGDGSVRNLWSRAFPVRNERKELTRIVGFISDVTERKVTEQQTLRHAMELAAERQRVEVLADFIRDTSHDLRTPLTVIATSLYSVRILEDAVRRNEKIDAIERHLKYLNNLIEQLQLMAVLDSTRELQTTPFNINRLLKDAIAAISADVEKKSQIVTTNLKRDLPTIPIDVDKLYRAVRSILSNAIQFTPVGGKIELATSLAPDGNSAVIEVRDSGIGIAAEDLPHVASRFYKADKARGAGTGGSGLGLAMVTRIMELHGGSLDIQSELGVGTVVHLMLPLQAKDNPDSSGSDVLP